MKHIIFIKQIYTVHRTSYIILPIPVDVGRVYIFSACINISAHVHKHHSIDNWKLESDRDTIFFSKLELEFLDGFTFITLCPIVIVTMVSLPNDDNSNADDEARRSTTEDIKEMEELLPSILRAHGVVEAKDGDSINTLDGVHFKGLVCY